MHTAHTFSNKQSEGRYGSMTKKKRKTNARENENKKCSAMKVAKGKRKKFVFRGGLHTAEQMNGVLVSLASPSIEDKF